MPSRNVIKEDVAGGYYHIYARGVDKRQIFHDPKDCTVFLNLLKRYLSKDAKKDSHGILYPHLRGEARSTELLFNAQPLPHVYLSK